MSVEVGCDLENADLEGDERVYDIGTEGIDESISGICLWRVDVEGDNDSE